MTSLVLAQLRSLKMKSPVARAHAHRMVPRQGKSPPYQRAKDCLAQCQRQNVSLLRKQPSHPYATDKRQRHQHRVGPVQRGENGPGSEGGVLRLFKRAQQAVVEKGIERDLLQEAKCEVSSEAPHTDQVCRQTVEHAEKQP